MIIDSVLLMLSYVLPIAIAVFIITILVTIWEELRWIIKDGVARLKRIHSNRKGSENDKKR